MSLFSVAAYGLSCKFATASKQYNFEGINFQGKKLRKAK